MYRKITVLLMGMIFTINTTALFAQSSKNTDKYLYGIASIYEDSFEGKVMASGSTYSSQSLTAGHRSLPFGTRIQVENLSNGKKVQVIINDRGPFEKNRILSLSKKSAEILEFISEGTTFIKITILELGSSLPSPLGLPEPPIGKDIPQNAVVTNTPVVNNIPPDMVEEDPAPEMDPVVAEPVLANDPVEAENIDEYDYDTEYEDEVALFDDASLFADLDDEVDFLDEELISEDSQLKAQELPSTIDSSPAVAPISGFSPTDDILINDPLSNITISDDEMFVAEPVPPLDNKAPYELTQDEKRLLEDNSVEDPFSDLFNDSVDAFPFQSEVGSTVKNSPLANDQTAENVFGDTDGMTNVAPRPNSIFKTNIITVTNFLTNAREITNTVTVEDTNKNESSTQVSPAVPEDEMFDDFYYDDSIQSNEPEKVEGVTATPDQPQVVETPTEPVDNTPVNTAPTPKTKEPQPLELQKLGNHYIIQLGAFSKQKNALDLYENLRKNGFNAYITDVKVKGKNLMRVRVGYFKVLDEALQVSLHLKENYSLDNRIIQVDYEK